ncbi:hypothetical protein TA3x_000814 [Tundrisphaera sp. TA3]|uniref:hypothetical protein n=1 Tax=Tundrisphaera sp. TA3 TaxID=3435775 RepID=UPI003EB849DC
MTTGAGTAESVTLAKALAIKNRLAGRLSQARSNIETYNSVLAGRNEAGTSLDVHAEYDRLLTLQEAMVIVKATIQEGNIPIYRDILRLAEKKALVQMFQGLNTKHGVEPGYGGAEYRFEAAFTKPDTLERIRRLESEIDAIQDLLTHYNNTTRVELPTAVLDLAR